MNHSHRDLLSRCDAVEEVLSLRKSVLGGKSIEAVPLDRISGRTITNDLVADRDNPARDFATMDGFAFNATDGYPLELVDGEVFPESSPRTSRPERPSGSRRGRHFPSRQILF